MVEIERVPDEEIERLAREAGPLSAPAQVLKELRLARTRDVQAFAYRVGKYWVTGPTLDARAEAALIELAEADEAQ
jgi:hypothetical protein